jgi:hypothetical protein
MSCSLLVVSSLVTVEDVMQACAADCSAALAAYDCEAAGVNRQQLAAQVGSRICCRQDTAVPQSRGPGSVVGACSSPGLACGSIAQLLRLACAAKSAMLARCCEGCVCAIAGNRCSEGHVLPRLQHLLLASAVFS